MVCIKNVKFLCIWQCFDPGMGWRLCDNLSNYGLHTEAMLIRGINNDQNQQEDSRVIYVIAPSEYKSDTVKVSITIIVVLIKHITTNQVIFFHNAGGYQVSQAIPRRIFLVMRTGEKSNQ